MIFATAQETRTGFKMNASQVTELPPTTKAIAGVIIGLFVLGFIAPGIVEDGLTLKPTNTYGKHSFVWNLITFALVESRLLSFITNTACVIGLGRLMEARWGSTELAMFYGFVALSTGLTAFIFTIVGYAATLDDGLFETSFHGTTCLVGALTIAMRQVAPDQAFSILDTVKFQGRHLPLLFLGLALVTGLLGEKPGMLLGVYGLWNGWVYLRFFQANATSPWRGDSDESMSFASFFPEPINGPVAILSTILFKIFCARCLPLPNHFHSGGSAVGGTGDAAANRTDNLNGVAVAEAPPLPGSNAADAERRRAKAMQLLDARLKALDTPNADSPAKSQAMSVSAETDLQAGNADNSG